MTHMVLLVVVMAMVHGAAQATILSKDFSKTLMKRDYAVQAEPADPMPSDPGENGFYYYYYPVEEGSKGKDKYKDDLDYFDDKKCTGEKLLAPLIIISIFLGIIAFREIGLVPSFNIPAIDIPEISLSKARSLASSATSYIPWGAVSNMTVAVLEVVEEEECLPWLVCESGRLAEGRTTVVSVIELFAPRKYEPQMKIFKDSALQKTSCDKYKCGYLKGSLCALLQVMGTHC